MVLKLLTIASLFQKHVSLLIVLYFLFVYISEIICVKKAFHFEENYYVRNRLLFMSEIDSWVRYVTLCTNSQA